MQLLQSWTSCDHAKTVLSRTLEGASDSVHGAVCGHSSCATETGARAVSALGLPVMPVMAAMKGFLAGFFRIFRAPPVVQELSASFWSPRWRRVLFHRGLLCTIHRTLLT